MITRLPTFRQFTEQADNISREYDKLERLMYQADTGNKLMHASDDPVLAYQIDSKKDYIDILKGYNDNGVIAQSRNALTSTAAQNASNMMTQVLQYIKEAENNVLGDSQRANIASQLQGCLGNLLNIANTQDANGQYIFSGSNPSAAAYSKGSTSYLYQGASQSSIDLAPGMSTVYGEDGSTVFGNIPTGNGTFTISAGVSNTGSAWASPGTTNTTGYVSDNYTVTFGTNTSNQLVYEVVGTTSGQLIPAPPATFPNGAPVFQSGENITFNGVTIAFNGQPNSGDTFQVQSSANQDIFDTVQSAINLLQTPVSNMAQYNQAITQLSASIMQAASHFAGYQAQVGVRSSAVNSQVECNASVIKNQELTLKDIAYVDVPSTLSQLSQQSILLQMTQEGYLKMQDTLNRLLQMHF